MNESKASYWQKFKRWFGKRRVEKGIAKAESEYMDALVDLCPLAREERIKRLVAYALPGWHLHRNPKGTEEKIPTELDEENPYLLHGAELDRSVQARIQGRPM